MTSLTAQSASPVTPPCSAGLRYTARHIRGMAVRIALCRRDDLAQPSSPTAELAQGLSVVPQGSEGAVLRKREDQYAPHTSVRCGRHVLEKLADSLQASTSFFFGVRGIGGVCGGLNLLIGRGKS